MTQKTAWTSGELLAEADRIRAMTAGVLPDSTDLIREDRDSR